MFIQTEQTPNPATLKFLPGLKVMPTGTVDWRSADEASVSPLGRRLFDIAGISGVFLGDDFISVTKDGGEWHQLKPMVLGAIMEHFTTGDPVFDGGEARGGHDEPVAGPGIEPNFNEEDRAIVEQINELLETRVRPAVAQDGGDITLHGYEEGIVYLHMRGACAGCPSSTMTLKHGIERLLQHFVPEVTEVRQVF
jgi:Fe-S cluster biogenesis protein NfuA